MNLLLKLILTSINFFYICISEKADYVK